MNHNVLYRNSDDPETQYLIEEQTKVLLMNEEERAAYRKARPEIEHKRMQDKKEIEQTAAGSFLFALAAVIFFIWWFG